MHTLKRGADGWRGIINEQFSSASAIHLCLGIAHFLYNREKKIPILITHDGRLQSKETTTDILQALSKFGYDITFGGMQSTPATSSFLTGRKFSGAILVTASHNPFYWNGIKVKVSPGIPLSRADEEKIEKTLENLPSRLSDRQGEIIHLNREVIFSSYAHHSLKILKQEEIEAIRKRKFKIVVDSLHGMSADSYRILLQELGCELTILGGDPHPLFHGILPDPMNPLSRRRISEHMQHGSYDLGFVSDGDGDRLGVLDEQGTFIWPHDILGLIAEEILIQAPAESGIAVSGPTGSIIDRMCERLYKRCIKTPVGFKYASAYLQSKEAMIAGGAVGEIGFSADNMDRDPLKSIALLLRCCLQKEKKLSQIIQDLHDRYETGSYRQWTLSNFSQDIDLKTWGSELIAELGYSVQTMIQLDGYRFEIDRTAWILVRQATTEKGIRVYAELHSEIELVHLFQLMRKKTGITPQEKA